MTALLTLLWGAITSKFAGPICLATSLALSVALAVAAIQGGVYKHDAVAARAAEVRAASNLATANASLANETAALDAQGRAVAALKAEGDARTAAASRAVQAAQALTATLSKREAELAAIHATADKCADTDHILTGGVQ